MSNAFDAAVGRRLAEIRQPLSQWDLADRMNREVPYRRWDQVLLSRIERGSRPMRLREAVDFAGVLGCTVNELLPGPAGDSGQARRELARLRDEIDKRLEFLA